jgi:ribonucleoside-diphosphate reductase alpha chain
MLKVKETYKRVSYKLARVCKFEVLEDSLKKYIVEGMKTSDITKMMIKSAIDLISVENTSWQFIAGRLALIDLYKEASKNRNMDIKKIYEAKHYLTLFKDYIKKGLYSKDFFNYYTEEDILEAGKYLNKEYDFDYNYTTMMMYRKRYLLNPNKIVFELPQEMYMSVALFLAMPEPKENRLEFAKKIYDACATGKVSLPTPTLLNARTNFHQLSSCFKFNVEDDLRAIYHNIENMAQVSKFGG